MLNRYIKTTFKTFDMSEGLHTVVGTPLQFINSLTTFNDLTSEDIKKIIHLFGSEGHNTLEDAIADLEEKVAFYKTMPDPIYLYRAVSIDDGTEINLTKLGEHYTPHLWAIDDDMLRSIGSESWVDTATTYIMEVSAPISEINIKQTLIQNLSFPNEHEINLKNNGLGATLIRYYKKE